MLPLPLHIAGVQYHCHQLYPAYSSFSAVCQRVLPSTVLTSFQMTPKYNPLMNSEILKHPICPSWICWLSGVMNQKSIIMCDYLMKGDNASVCELKTAHMRPAYTTICHMCLFESSLSSRVNTTLLFINASQRRSGDEADWCSSKHMLFIFFFYPTAIVSCSKSGVI